ncbi:MAG: SAM-dependent chlorinase/fluorinase [Deltaproteobacteria bacterium]
MDRIITLTTDFGLKDPYQGAMKGVILGINPYVRIVDITHLISPGNILECAYVLRDACNFFPEGAIHVGVVDPGVGGKRKPILIETDRHFFIGPDNGIFSLAADKKDIRRVIELKNREYFLKETGNTFHGRDIFAPVAGHLSLGLDPEEFGEELAGALSIEVPEPEKKGDTITGTIVYIDSFGNLTTDIRKEDILKDGLAVPCEVEVKGRILGPISKTYGSAGIGEPLALIGGSNFLEIAVNGGSASAVLDAATGVKVTVRIRRG